MDPNLALMTGNDTVITPTAGLVHELCHTYQDDVAHGKIRDIPLLTIENANVQESENPITKELGAGQRRNYFNWKYSFKTDGISSKTMKNPGAISWVSSLDREFIVRSPALAGSLVHTPIRKSVYSISWGGKFPEQAPGYGPSLPINEKLEYNKDFEEHWGKK